MDVHVLGFNFSVGKKNGRKICKESVINNFQKALGLKEKGIKMSSSNYKNYLMQFA